MSARKMKLELMVTEEEAAKLKKQAAEKEMSLSDLMRTHLGLPLRQRPPREDHALLNHFRRKNARRSVEPGLAALERIARRG